MPLTSNPHKNFIFRLTATLILSLAFSSFTIVSRAQIDHQANASNAASNQKYPATIALLELFIRREMADKDLPGISIALVEDQKIVWQQSDGFSDPQAKTPITANTVFRIGSVSKLFTDVAVMQLTEQGKLDKEYNAL